MMLGHCSSNEAPEFPAFAIDYSESDRDAHERCDAVHNVVMLRLGSTLIGPLHGVERPLVILPGTVNCFHDRLIARNQTRRIHLRYEVERADCIVSRGICPQQSALALEPLPKLRV